MGEAEVKEMLEIVVTDDLLLLKTLTTYMKGLGLSCASFNRIQCRQGRKE